MTNAPESLRVQGAHVEELDEVPLDCSKIDGLQTPLQTVLRAQADVEELARRILDIDAWDAFIAIAGQRFDGARIDAWTNRVPV